MSSKHYRDGIHEIAQATRTSLNMASRACHDAIQAAKHEQMFSDSDDGHILPPRQPPETRFGTRRLVART
jgi:hypothetical protein